MNKQYTPIALMVNFDWLEKCQQQVVDWRFATIKHGEVYVTMGGTLLMVLLHAGNLDSNLMVMSSIMFTAFTLYTLAEEDTQCWGDTVHNQRPHPFPTNITNIVIYSRNTMLFILCSFRHLLLF